MMDPAPFLCSEDGCLALVSEIPGYCPAHQGQPREYEFEPLPPSAGPATLVRRRATCQAPAGDVPAHAPLTARLCGRPATTSATVEGVTFAMCAACAQELTMVCCICCICWDEQDSQAPGWAWKTAGASGPVDGDLAEDAELADVLDAAGSDLPEALQDAARWTRLDDGSGWEVRELKVR